MVETELDRELVPGVLELIEEVGTTAKFTVPAYGDYNPNDGSVVQAGPMEYSLKVSPPAPFKTNRIDGDLIQASDLQVLLPAKDLKFEPKKGMRVELDRKTYRIESIDPIKSGEMVCAWGLGLRA